MSSPDTEFISILGVSGSPEAPSRISTRSLPETLPILGLSDIVIFPNMVAPLLVETFQSTKLIDDVVGGDRLQPKPYRSDDKLRLPAGGYPRSRAMPWALAASSC